MTLQSDHDTGDDYSTLHLATEVKNCTHGCTNGDVPCLTGISFASFEF